MKALRTIITTGLISAGYSWAGSFQVTNSVSWLFPGGPEYTALSGYRAPAGSSTAMATIPVQGENASVPCPYPSGVICSAGYTVTQFNGFPSSANYAITSDISGIAANPSMPVFIDGETRLFVGAAGSSQVTLPIPALDCDVQIIDASARCDVATSAIQPGAGSYINSYRGFQLLGTGAGDLTAASFMMTGSDYTLYLYFHQGNFTDPGTDASINIVASSGQIITSQFLNPGVYGGLPLPAILLPSVGSSSGFNLTLPAIPALPIDPNLPLSSIEMDQFLQGTIAAAVVPEPAGPLLSLVGLTFCGMLLFKGTLTSRVRRLPTLLARRSSHRL